MSRNSYHYTTGCGGNVKKLELTSLTLDKDHEGYYLSAKYKVEDQHSIREADIPRIRLKINEDNLCIDTEYTLYSEREYAQIDLGFGYLPLEYTDVNGQYVCYTEKVLEEKYTEMTMDEIEKKLGYKVKIVSEKKE